MILDDKAITIDEMLQYMETMLCHKYDLKNCPDDLKKYVKSHSKRMNKNKVNYYNFICSFDIEDTNLYHYERNEKTGKDEVVADGSTMYVWQFGFQGKVCLGRTWEEFKDFMDRVSALFSTDTTNRLVIWVHNLAHEWAFIYKKFIWLDIFAKDVRKPIRACTYEGLEFRCSYALAGASLGFVGEKMLTRHNVKKGGDFDYTKLRGSNTSLTDEEIGYCVNDCTVLMAYIDEVLEDENTDMAHVRMTKTGMVRNYMKKICVLSKFSSGYKATINELTLEKQEYKYLRQAFQGGITHANIHTVQQTIENVDSFDLTSSYPTVLCSELYPMSKGMKSKRDFKDYEMIDLINRKYLAVFAVKFTNLEATVTSENIISESKCFKSKGIISNNGRVMAADEVTLIITNVDLMNYARFYKWDDAEIYNVIIYRADYLPKQFIWGILDLYKKKTELKDTDEVALYNMAKSQINSVFGDSCTDPVYSKIVFENGRWFCFDGDIEESLKVYNENKTRYNFYAWGVFCTAYARYNLCSAIKSIDETCKQLGVASDYHYSDTDSCKFSNLNRHIDFFNDYNKKIIEKVEACLKYRNIDVEMAKPKTVFGVEKPLGVWDHETKGNPYLRFKTLGAKRYMYECKEKDGSIGLHITVAGVNKKMGAKFLSEIGNDSFESFDFGLNVDAEHSGRLTAHYFDDDLVGTFIDYQGNVCPYHEQSCVCLCPSEFSIKHNSLYEQLITVCKNESGVIA